MAPVTTKKKTLDQCKDHPGEVDGSQVRKRLARIEGQVRGITKMVDEERYCIDVLTQIAAVHEALRSVGRQILERHMQTCVARAMRSGNPAEADRVGRELVELLERFTR
jgi:DNA-binding FrmR family transcriptional regulator